VVRTRRLRRARTRRGGWDLRAGACLVLALLALAGGVALALAHIAPRRSGTNGVAITGSLGAIGPGGGFCQSGETLPADTGALGISLGAGNGPELNIVLRRGARTLDQIPVLRGWGGSGVLVPIAQTTRELDGVTVCVGVASAGQATLLGGPTPAHRGAVNGTGGSSVRVDYFQPESTSWLADASTVASRLGLGRGSWSGDWVAWMIAAIVLAAIALTVAVALRTIVAVRVPSVRTVAVAIGLVACLNGVAWSLITPPFQVPDEFTHMAYAQQVAETGSPPVERHDPGYSPALRVLMGDVHAGAVGRNEDRAAVWTAGEERRLERDLAAPLSRRGNGDAGPANPEPPLYYALEAIPYRAAIGADLLLRFQLMRLFSALMAGATAVLVFLFVRECLPRRPWAWSVGGLAAACMPELGFMSGGVNPDALLFAVSAALLLCLARAFRRGLTTRLAVWTGVVLAVGMVAKLNFYGLVPGALLALALLARRAAGGWNGRALRLVAIAAGIGIAPYALMTLLDAAVWGRPAILAHSASSAHHNRGGLANEVASLWQFYLPRLPWQRTQYPMNVGYELIFKSFVGTFGRLAVLFPNVVYRAALGAFALLGALAARAMIARRGRLRSRRGELLGYGAIAAGLLLLVDLIEFRGWAPTLAGAAQGRYLLPLLGLFAAFLALAARGAGRWGRALGAAIVVGAVAWGLFGQLLTVAYFYG
jgi:hypothetical protein